MPIRTGFLILCAVGLAGCGATREEVGPGSVIPSVEAAQSALEASLAAWQQGKLGHSVTATIPTVEVVDSFRDPKRPLKAYEILGPIEAERFRCFAVRLSLDNPQQDQVVRYLVIGLDPVWVFRQEDLERTSHWEHKMEESEPAEAASPEKESRPVHG